MASLKELAEIVGGTVIGDSNLEIRRLAPIDQAEKGDITFISNLKYASKLKECCASAVIVPPDFETSGFDLIVTPNPYLAFAKVLTYFHVRKPESLGIMKGAQVDSTAVLGADVTIHPGCVVGRDVVIGRGSILHPGVVLYEGVHVGEDSVLHAGVIVREGCRIGHRVILQPSVVIGSDGFGFAPDGSKYYKIPQVGIVEIEDDVEIGACTCVDRAAIGVTRIKRGTKLDNLIQVAHNVVIGEDTVMSAQVGISGSTIIGNHCTFGGQSATSGHNKIGNNVTIAARGGVSNDVADNQFLAGFPVIPHKEWLKSAMTFTKLPEMRKEISRLKKRLEEIEMFLKEN